MHAIEAWGSRFQLFRVLPVRIPCRFYNSIGYESFSAKTKVPLVLDVNV